jgi:hypothetical protein
MDNDGNSPLRNDAEMTHNALLQIATEIARRVERDEFEIAERKAVEVSYQRFQFGHPKGRQFYDANSMRSQDVDSLPVFAPRDRTS